MKGMKSAQEFTYVLPPAGTYRTKVVTAEAKLSKSSNTMLEIEVEILEPVQFAGTSVRDWIGTDGSTRFGEMGKRKLRGLGVEVDATDEEIPDSQIAHQLLGREVWTTFKHEPRMEKSDTGEYDKPVYDFVNGKQVPRMQLRVSGYGGILTHAGKAQQQQFQQQFAPQQPAFQQPQQFAAPQRQFVPQQQQFVPQQPQQQFQQPAPQAPVAPQFPQFAGQNGAAVPPWMQAPQQGVPGVQASLEAPDAGEGKKRSRKS